jgi:hypothetical protein
VTEWTNDRIVFTFDRAYHSTAAWVLNFGDDFTVYVRGTSCNGTFSKTVPTTTCHGA